MRARFGIRLDTDVVAALEDEAARCGIGWAELARMILGRHVAAASPRRPPSETIAMGHNRGPSGPRMDHGWTTDGPRMGDKRTTPAESPPLVCSGSEILDLPTQSGSDLDLDLTPAIQPLRAAPPLVLVPDEPGEDTAVNALLAVLERAAGPARFSRGTRRQGTRAAVFGGRSQRKAFPDPADWQLVGDWLAAHEPNTGPKWYGSHLLSPTWAAGPGFREAHIQASAWDKRGRGPPGAMASPAPRSAFSVRAVECFAACAAASNGKFAPPAERTVDAATRVGLEGLAEDFDPPDWKALGALFAAEATSKFMRDVAISPSLLARKGRDLMARAHGAAEARRTRAPSHFGRRAHEEDARRPDPIDTDADDIPDFG